MKHRYGIESLARGLEVLGFFSPRRPSLTLAEIVKMSGLSKSTAFRILKTLEAVGYLEMEPSEGTYRPGLKVLTLGFAALSGFNLREIARPHLHALAQETDLTTSLSVLDRMDVIYIDRVRNRSIVNLWLGPGARVPANCTSMGKVLLAGLPAVELKERLKGGSLEACTPRSVVEPKRLMAEIERVRRQGYAINDGELALGLRAVAAPIRDPAGSTLAAINVAGTQEVIDELRLREDLPHRIVSTAREISAYLTTGREAIQ